MKSEFINFESVHLLSLFYIEYVHLSHNTSLPYRRFSTDYIIEICEVKSHCGLAFMLLLFLFFFFKSICMNSMFSLPA